MGSRGIGSRGQRPTNRRRQLSRLPSLPWRKQPFLPFLSGVCPCLGPAAISPTRVTCKRLLISARTQPSRRPPSLSPRHSPMSSSKFMALSAISKLMTQIYSFSSDLSPDLQRHIVNRSLYFPPGCLVRAQNELVTREPACSFVVNPSSFPLDYCYGLQNEFSPSPSLSLSLESPSVL